jgi:kynureninase
LCKLFIDLAEARCGRHGVRLDGPHNMEERGSHVALHCPEGYAVMQALIAHGVIGDFRAPDLIRFGLAPLYIGYSEVWDAVDILARILDEELWDAPQFRVRKAVT